MPKSLDGVLVVTIEHTSDEYACLRIQKELSERFGCEVLVVSRGVDVKLLSRDVVYHREKLGDYEIEVFAKTEADLAARLEMLHGLPRPAVVEARRDS